MNFTAPGVSVLIVDDNEINLEVTAGLLEPLQMKIDMADSGRRALQMAQKTRYHLIFMDHMMPVMDGVETTKRLRQMKDEYYHKVPVIALTASALKDVRAEFMKAGMNDYLGKPVEAMELYRCVLKWIPRKMIVISNTNQKLPGLTGKSSGPGETEAEKTPGGHAEGGLPELPGIHAADGIKYTGSEKMWLKLLGDFYKLIDSKARKIEHCLEDGLIRDYTIEVHAMKNTARMIGAAHLSEWFFKMEQCGKAGDIETITRETPGLLRELRSYKEVLRPFGEENERNKTEAPAGELIRQLTKMRNAMDRVDLDEADEAMQQLEKYRIPSECRALMDLLRAAVADVNVREVMDAADKMIAMLRS